MKWAMLPGILVGMMCMVCTGAQDGHKAPLQAQLKLKNGSLIKGTIEPFKAVTLKTRFGTLQIPIDELRSVRWGRVAKEERDSIRTTQGVFTGYVENRAPFVVDTGYGTLRIPPDAVRQLRIVHEGLGDDFEGFGLEGWEVKNGNWTVNDGVLQVTCSSNYHNQIHFEETMEGEYILEAKIKGWQQIGVVWHAKSTSDAYVLWVTQNQVYVYGGLNWWGRSVANWNYRVPQNDFYRVRLDVQETKTTVYINDTKLGDVTTNRAEGKVGLFLYNGSAQFDDFAIEQ